MMARPLRYFNFMRAAKGLLMKIAAICEHFGHKVKSLDRRPRGLAHFAIVRPRHAGSLYFIVGIEKETCKSIRRAA
jgi:hypothetical protein